MLKRIGLFLLTNIAVLFVFNIVLYVLSLFGINVGGGTYTGLLIMCAIFGFLGSGISLLMSKWVAKRAYNITPIKAEHYSELKNKEKVVWDTVKTIAENHNIKMPEVGIYQDSEANAFATGASKNSSLVAVSSGLLDLMDDGAIEGVVAHEMAHVLNGDMITMTLLQGVVNTFVLFFAKIIANAVTQFVDEDIAGIARFVVDIALQIIFGILASVITMGFSRWREFHADAGSAKFVGKEKMIAGLEALQKMQAAAKDVDTRFATMQISTKKERGFMKFFASHPPLEDRIKALEELRV